MLVVRFQKTFPLRVNEWFLAGVLFLWGLILAQPHDIFSNPIYSGLVRFAPQETWAFFCMVTGAIRLAALAINGAWRPSPHIRCALAFITCFFWLQIVFGLAQSDAPSTGLAVYPMILMLDLYSCYRASVDAKISDDKAKSKKILEKD